MSRPQFLRLIFSGVFLPLFLVGCFGHSFGPLKENLGPCSPNPCLKLSISDVPELPATMPPAAREEVTRAIKAALFASVDGEESTLGHETLVKDLNALVLDANPELSTDWDLERTASLLYANDRVLTVDVWNRGFLGGAHGFDIRTIMSFEVSTGHKLELDEIVAPNSRSIFETIAEFEFRRVRQVPMGTELEDAGFSVRPGQPFVLPKNFGIVEGGILLYYNAYEIAAYVFGPTEVLLPKDAVSAALNPRSPEVSHLTALPAAELPSGLATL